MAQDPYARYLQQAEELFSGGEVVRAGQIWQAILKQVPDHGPAREGLLRVKATLDAQRAAAVPDRATESPIAVPLASAPSAPGPTTASGSIHSKITEPVPMPEPPPAPEPVAIALSEPTPDPVPVPARPVLDEDTQDKLLREGCTLYDMGQTEDALRKWDQLLASVPDHAMALEYAQGARKELGLPLDGSVSLTAHASSHPVTQEIPIFSADEEAADKLLREGCLLYDMGLAHEAIGKWEQAIKRAPHRSDIQGFLDSAHKEMEAEQNAPAPQPAGAAVESPADEKVRQAEHLMSMQRYEEAAFSFQQALDLNPAHPAAKAGLLRCRSAQGSPAPSVSSSSRQVPLLIEMNRPDPEPEVSAQESAQAQPPEALTKPAPAPRTGLQIKTPTNFDFSNIPDWAKEPKVWIAAASTLLVIIFGTLWYNSHSRDSQLQADVEAAHQTALAKAAKDAQVPALSETPSSILAEGREALSTGDAVRAYFRAQSLLKDNPSDGPAAQLLENARAALGAGGLVGATSEEYQKHIQNGDLDQAAEVMDALLRSNPDDPSLRRQAMNLYVRLAEAHASQGKWSDAKEDLQRGRALGPKDPAWSARLALLDKIQSLPKGDRTIWIALLG